MDIGEIERIVRIVPQESPVAVPVEAPAEPNPVAVPTEEPVPA